MATIKFIFEGTEFDCPLIWHLTEWFMRFMSRDEAKRANKAWRQFIIEQGRE